MSTATWKVGFVGKGHSGWGAAVDVNVANAEILIESESMPAMAPETIDDANIGDVLLQGVAQGNIEGEGNIVLPARYEGVENFIAQIMGDDAVAAGGADIGETAGTARQHVMPFLDTLLGIMGTLGIYKGIVGELWEYPTVKESQLELNHNNGKLMLTPTFIPNKCERDTAAHVATDPELDSATPRTRALLALFNQLTVRIVETTDGGSEGNLTSTHDVCVTNAQLSINRNISGVPDSCNSGEVGEPTTDGLPEATLTLSLQDYDAASDAFIKAAQLRYADGQPKTYKCQLLWRGDDIAGSDATTGPGTGGKNVYAIEFDFPAIQLRDPQVNGSGPGARVSHDLTFRVMTPQWVPNGSDWAWVVAGVVPFRARVINEKTTVAV